ncbi:MAG: prephenate dehydrogenase [Hydrogenobaculum sp.]|nr:MAG: prephenate dehydrogenase/arogenate dehydrogenase family protein [Hydrogenobaculum sp.]HEK25044.1 prephenate dehydrogenase [Hydrogenobaculum sp.]
MFYNTLIVGLGLIGGSLAFDIKSKKLSKHLYALDKDQETLKTAVENGLIDGIFKEGVKYDFVIFCNPISTLENVAKDIKEHIKDAVITDVASVKEYPESVFKPIFKERYVGSHPIAGSHKNGFENASKDLFSNRLTIVCPTDISKEEHIEKVKTFWEHIGAKVEVMSAKTHDEIFAVTSHLPHLIAYALTKTLPEEYKNYVGQGFLDTTRIGASQSDLWADIFLYNQENVLKSIELFKKQLDILEQAIKDKNKENLKGILDKVSKKRKSL